MELLPPPIRDRALLALLGDILNDRAGPAADPGLRLRLMRTGFSWQALVQFATQQDLLIPLIRALFERGLLPPVPRAAKYAHDSHVTLRLRQYYCQHLARRDLQKKQIQNILARLNRAGIVPLLLKGARYLVAPLAPWCEARTLRDIDILLRPGDADRAFSELVAGGYRPGQPYSRDYHHLADLQRQGEPASVEIHTAALATAGESVMSTEFVWQNAERSADGSFFVLPAKWQSLHCLLHHQLSDRGYARRVLALKPLWEWTMLSRDSYREDWQHIESHIRQTGASDALGSWVIQADRLFGATFDQLCPPSVPAVENAAETLALALAPHWRRRSRFVVDQLRCAFARDTLAARYGKPADQISVADAARYLRHLLRQHRGRLLRRLAGRSDSLS